MINRLWKWLGLAPEKCSTQVCEKASSSELEHQRQADIETIETLRAHGSNLEKPHLVEHHFLAPTQTDGQGLKDWAAENGIQTSELRGGEYKGTRYYYFDLIKPTIPSIENISEDTHQMLRLANKFNCDYDGWGCEVES